MIKRLWPTALLGAAVLGATALPAAAVEWAQWLGPQRNGVSPETGLLASWPADSGPAEVWRHDLGLGFSGMAVAGGRLYTAMAASSGEYLVCLAAKDGRELWRQRLDTEVFKDGQGGHGPRSTPAVAEGRVFAASGHGKLYALDAASGKVLWRRDLKKDFGAGVPHWGYCPSPLVVDGKLLIEVGGKSKGVAAFDAADGGLLWAVPTQTLGYSSPIVATVGGVRQAIFLSGKELLGLDPAQGQVLWRFPWDTSYDVNAATPVMVGPDGVFISSGYGKGAALVKVARQGQDWRPAEVWRHTKMKNHFGTSVLYEGHLYGFDNSILKCLDAATGQERWKARGYGKGTLIVAEGRLVLLGEDGKLGLARATPEGFEEIVSTYVLHGKCWTVPSLSDGRLYLRNEQEIVCLDIRSP